MTARPCNLRLVEKPPSPRPVPRLGVRISVATSGPDPHGRSRLFWLQQRDFDELLRAAERLGDVR
jgi:hypothetical protein